MAGFIRRFGFNPGTEVLTQIEGVVVLDLPPPGAVQGVGVGTVGLIGEFVDMTYGVSVAPATGVISTKPVPVDVFSAQDAANKIGGFDPTIGDFGVSGGNGFCQFRNKQFQRLVVVPINLASDKGLRIFRQLPTNKSATSAIPITPTQAAVVAAGTEFKLGNNRVRTAGRVIFQGIEAYAVGTDGATAAVAAAATQTLTSAGSNFFTKGVKKGDVVVLGVIGAAGTQGTMAATYRVTADATSGAPTVLTVEKMDGSNFASLLGTNLVFRVHQGNTADSYGTGGCVGDHDQKQDIVPARPLDATITATSIIAPTVAPTTPTATTWNPLSGLAGVTDAAITYTAAVQAANAASAAGLEALYQSALDALLVDSSPARDVNIVEMARTSSVLRAALKAHVLKSSQRGVGRITCISPELNIVSVDSVIADADPGAGANRDERVIYNWPGYRTSIPEAVGYAIATADGRTTTDGILDLHLSGQMSSVLSVLPPELNPGQQDEPVTTAMANVLGFQRGAPDMGLDEYIQLKGAGIAALRMDRTAGPIFQSGVTTSLTSGRKNINRRRMADFIQDSLAQRLDAFTKKPLTNSLMDAAAAEVQVFLEELQSPNNPSAQRIVGFQIDTQNGNTPALLAQGIFVIIVRVQTLATADVIVLQTEIGENVQFAAAA